MSQLAVKTIRANGLDFAYLEAGEGPLILLLHGFPDTAYGYQNVMSSLAAAGYRAVAPFMRGYAPSPLASDGDYSIPALGRDVLALIEHFGGGEKARVVGHDWGSIATQYAANLRPDRFEKIVLCAVPQMRRFFLSLTPAQIKRSHYIFRFQAPLWAEKRIPKNDFAWLREVIFKRWSPGYDFSEEELAPLLEGFRDPARLKAALAYYRAIPATVADPRKARIAFRAQTVPAMVIFGSDDGCIGPDMFTKQEKRFKGGLKLVEKPGMGHFPQYEQPEWFAAQILEFLGNPAEQS